MWLRVAQRLKKISKQVYRRLRLLVKDENVNNVANFQELKWDTEFFRVTCSKTILYEKLTKAEWRQLKEKFGDYQFISIENRNSETTNAQLIATDTNAFLADVNIQFKKKIRVDGDMPEAVQIFHAMERDDRIITVGSFQFSKFTEDPELAKRGGAEVYRQWIINSFGKLDKFYAIAEGENGGINGFLLHSYSDKICTIELIAVSSNMIKCGIGTDLFKAVEYAAYKRGCEAIKVGTQVRNTGAINFYHKVGCKQVGSYQVYHLWNL